MKKILITGVSGFVGKHLVKHLLTKEEYEIIGTYRSDNSLGALSGLSSRITLEKVDLQNVDEVGTLLALKKPDAIYHLAAMTSPAESFKIPDQILTNNIISELHIFEALRQNKLEKTRVLIVSTSEVYGMVDTKDLPVDEDTPLNPVSPYAVSKIAQDYLGLQYHLSYDLDIIRVRPFNHIGPGQEPRFVLPAFAKQIAEIEKGKKEPVLSVGNLDAKRDFTDVRDIILAYELVMSLGKAGEVYNIGSGKSYKIKELLDKLLSLTTQSITVEKDQTKFRPVDIPDVVCDYAKLKSLTGWEPKIPIKQTLEDILDYWRNIV